VFWGASSDFPVDAQGGIETLFKSLDKSAYLTQLNQYFRGAMVSAPYAGTLFDSSATPISEPSRTAVAAAAYRALDTAAQAPAKDALYLVFSSNFPEGMHGCAWHSWSVCHDIPIAVALVPNPQGDPGRCLLLGPHTGGGVSAATAILRSFAMHEIVEAMSDPFLYSGWADPYSEEGADKCESYFAFTRVGDGTFWLQSVWSNAEHRCVR